MTGTTERLEEELWKNPETSTMAGHTVQIIKLLQAILKELRKSENP